MVPGFNTDFKYRGETYHIQTEDNGLGNPVVVTLLYHKGAILASRRTSYRDIAGTPHYQKELSALMKTQHKDLMRALLSGALDANGAAPAVAESAGQNPADAAAAVAAREAAQQKAPPSPPRVIPAQPAAPPAPPVPTASVFPVAQAAPRPAAVLRAAVRPTTPNVASPRAPTPATAPAATPSAPMTLDDQIRNYLREFAAAVAPATR